MRDDILAAIKQNMAINSVAGQAQEGMPFGKEPTRALEDVLAQARKMGFKTVNIDNMVGWAEYGEGDEMIAVSGHLDIVPAGDGWDYPPFGGEIHDGKLYGRGAVDNKGPIIGALCGLKAIKDLGLPLERRVRIIFGIAEETGCGCLKHYSATQEAPVAGFTPDATYPIIHAEKGLIIAHFSKKLAKGNKSDMNLTCLQGGVAPNVVPTLAEATIQVANAAQKAEDISRLIESKNWGEFMEVSANNGGKDEFYIMAEGVSAHGSTPELGKNAIIRLLACLELLDIQPDIKAFAGSITRLIGEDTQGHGLGIFKEDEVSGKMVVCMGTTELVEDEVRFSLNLRYPVTIKYDQVMPKLVDVLKAEGIETGKVEHMDALYLAPDTPLIQKLQKVYREKTGNEPTLIAIGGGTYAKCIANTVAFGAIFPERPLAIHVPNEYIEIEDLMAGIKISAEAIRLLAQKD